MVLIRFAHSNNNVNMKLFYTLTIFNGALFAFLHLTRFLIATEQVKVVALILIFTILTILWKVEKLKKGLSPFFFIAFLLATALILKTPFLFPTEMWQERLGAVIGVNALKIQKIANILYVACLLLGIERGTGLVRELRLFVRKKAQEKYSPDMV